MKLILRLFIVIIVLFCLWTEGAKCFKPEGKPVQITLHSKGNQILDAPVGGWGQEFLEENFYLPFDYFKVWMKTDYNGDKQENDNKTGEYAVFSDAEFWVNTGGSDAYNAFAPVDITHEGWKLLTNTSKMFEAYAPSTPSPWRSYGGGHFYFWLYFKNTSSHVTFYFEAYDTKSTPGIKKLVNFCAITNYDGGWHCNNFDRPVDNDLRDPVTDPQDGFKVIQDWHNGYELPKQTTQISYWSFDECTGNIVLDNGSGKNDGLVVGAERVDGFYGNGLKFNGNNLVDVGDVHTFDFGFDQPFTVAGWVKFNPWSNGEWPFGDFICKMSPPNDGWQGWGLGAGTFPDKCGNNTTGGFRFDLNNWWENSAIALDAPGEINTYWYDNHEDASIPMDDSRRFKTSTSPNGWGDNNWHFVVATYTANGFHSNGQANQNDLSIYIDGAKASCCPYVGGTPINRSNDANMRFGYRNSSDPTRGYHGNLDEVYAFNKALTPLEQAALYASYSYDPGLICGNARTTLVLDLEAKYAKDKDGNPIGSDNTAVQTIPDMAFTNSSNAEDAVMTDPKRQPVYKVGIFGEYEPGIMFTYDYGKLNYGISDIMQSPYNAEITSGVADMYSPDATTPKTLIVEFKVGESVNKDKVPQPYYSDGRQTIFEAGGPLSGYNMYISNGYLCFGMWNRFERKFIQFDGDNPSFYPLTPNTVYLANLEFDNDAIGENANPKFRVSVSMSNGSDATFSPWVPFSGLTYDGTTGSPDYSGVGGACRTAYYDYSTGETYSDHFGGYISGIWLYNELLVSPVLDGYYNTYGHLLGNNFSFAVPYPNDELHKDAWSISETNLLPESMIMSSAYPNPFDTKTSFGINLPEKQIVTVELYDAMGNRVQTIYTGELGKGVHDFSIDGSNLSSGMYVFKVAGNNFVETGKVVLNK